MVLARVGDRVTYGDGTERIPALFDPAYTLPPSVPMGGGNFHA
jgi:hypothetical protein